jgi:hypothetical protein
MQVIKHTPDKKIVRSKDYLKHSLEKVNPGPNSQAYQETVYNENKNS